MNDLRDKTIGYLGMGAIGFPICHGLVRSGYHVILPTWRRASAEKHGYSPVAGNEEEKRAQFDWMLSNGAEGAGSQRELLEKSDIVMLCLPKSKQVEEVVLGKDGILEVCKPGTIVIDNSSADFASTKRLAVLLKEKEIGMLDAPVSGGVGGAAKQTLSVMVGGEKELFDLCRPILDTIGDPANVIYFGGSGSGDLVKSANNFLSANAVIAAAEAMTVCVKAGIDPHLALQAFAAGSGSSKAVTEKYPETLLPGKPWNFSVGLMHKDIGLFCAAAKEMQVPAPAANLTEEIFAVPLAEEGGDAQCASVPKMYERWAGVQIWGIDRKPEP